MNKLLYCLAIGIMLYILCNFCNWVVMRMEKWIDEKSKGLR